MLQSVIVPMAAFAMVTLIVWFTNVTKRKEQERKAELVRALIERFDSPEDLTTALASQQGQALARILALDGPARKPGWLALVIPGSILLLLGLGFLALAGLALKSTGMLVSGVICSAVGTALLASAYLAWRTGEEGSRPSRASAGGTGTLRPAGDGEDA